MISSKVLEKIKCPCCGSDLAVIKSSKHFGILSCGCSKYPLVQNILYLNKDDKCKKAVELLSKDRIGLATFELIDLKKRTAYLAYFFLFFLSKKITKKIGFNNFIRLLTIFFYSKNWTNYLIFRDRTPAYYMNTIFSKTIGRNGYVVDFGTGPGVFLPILYKINSSSQVIGLDKSFFSLLLNRFFFAKSNTLLICYNAKDYIPFETSSIDNIVMFDTFNNLANKEKLIKEVSRVLNKNGIVCTTHCANKSVVFENYTTIKPKDTYDLLLSSGFRNIFFQRDKDIWATMQRKTEITISKSKTTYNQNWSDCLYYSFIASKGTFKNKIKLSIGEIREMNTKKLNYKWDQELAITERLNKLIEKFDNFLFVSSHFDDAIQSCGALIRRLRNSGKKISVISVFTHIEGDFFTPQAKEFISGCGYKNAHKLFKDRRKEDIKICKYLKINYEHLGYIDAAWRRNDKGNFIYTTSKKQFSGKVHREDYWLIESLRLIIEKYTDNKTVILSPIGVGGHVDHEIVKRVVKKIPSSKIFWEDFPYNLDHKNKIKRFDIEMEHPYDKIQMVRFYKSQMKSLFPKRRIELLPERYLLDIDNS